MKHKTVDYKKHPPGIILTKATIDRIKKEPHSGDLLGLYTWYCYTSVWQDTNIIWANVSYMAKLTKWSLPKVRRTRKQLLELGLIEDIQQRNEDGNFGKRYVRVLYITVVCKNGSTEKGTAKCLITNTKVLGTNNYREARKRPRKTTSKSSDGDTPNPLIKDNSFTIKYGAKIQAKLKIHAAIKHKGKTINRPVSASTWSKQIICLLHNMRVDKEVFKEVMKWYFTKGSKLEFTPRIYKPKDLVEKWYSIEDAMNRELKEEYDKEVHPVYRMGGNGEMGYFEDDE